jgi:hypothetical protein
MKLFRDPWVACTTMFIIFGWVNWLSVHYQQGETDKQKIETALSQFRAVDNELGNVFIFNNLNKHKKKTKHENQ